MQSFDHRLARAYALGIAFGVVVTVVLLPIGCPDELDCIKDEACAPLDTDTSVRREKHELAKARIESMPPEVRAR